MGIILIRRRSVTHRNIMLAILVRSTLFLIAYLVEHSLVGSECLPGTGAARIS